MKIPFLFVTCILLKMENFATNKVTGVLDFIKINCSETLHFTWRVFCPVGRQENLPGNLYCTIFIPYLVFLPSDLSGSRISDDWGDNHVVAIQT